MTRSSVKFLTRYFNVLQNIQFYAFFSIFTRKCPKLTGREIILASFEHLEIPILKPKMVVFELNSILSVENIVFCSSQKIFQSYPKSIKIERFDSTDSTGTTKSKNDKNNPYEKPPYSYMAMIQVNI